MDFNCSHRFLTLWFFMLGLLVYLPVAEVIWVASEDILSGSILSTPVILLVFSVLDILSKSCSPILVVRIPFTCAMVLQSCLTAAALLIIILGHNVNMRILGVAVLALPYGLGVVTCLRMAAYYESADILGSAFVLGSNVSTFVASIVYTGKFNMCTFYSNKVNYCRCADLLYAPMHSLLNSRLCKAVSSQGFDISLSNFWDLLIFGRSVQW